MKIKTEQATRIKTFANDIGAKYALYRPLVEDILYDYVREEMPKKLSQFLDESPAVDDYLNRMVCTQSTAIFVKKGDKDDYADMMDVCVAFNQLDICIEKAEKRLCKDIAKYLKFKNLEVKPESLITPAEFSLQMKELAKMTEEDEEIAHGKADQLMTDTLTALGYKEGCDIFDDMPKWYA